MCGKCRGRICAGDIRATPTNQQQGHYDHVDCLPKPFGQLALNAASDFAASHRAISGPSRPSCASPKSRIQLCRSK
eukprot:8042165-Alexandrium_andersonii.AAC.1